MASWPKSGSTWIRHFLNCYVTHYPLAINAANQYAAGDLHEPAYQSASVRPITELTSTELFYIRPAALMNQLALAPGRDICLKTHNCRGSYNGIIMCPTPLTRGALYVVRDPRDVVISYAKHSGQGIDEAIGCMNCPTQIIKHPSGLSHYLNTWSMHVRSWLETNEMPNAGWVRYEDMLADTASTFRKILAAVGFPDVNEDALEFALEQTAFEKFKQQEEKESFNERGDSQEVFFNRGTSGHWKEVLSPEQAARIESDHGEVMTQLGYL